MSWPLGYSKRSVQLRSTLDGVIFANDSPVTESGGWLDLTMPPSARARGAPEAISLRIRVSADADGEPFLYAEQIEVHGRRYHGVHALIMNEGAPWVGSIATVVHAHIDRAVAQRTGPHATDRSRCETKPMRAVRADPPIPTPDDTWEGRTIDPRVAHASTR